MPGSLLQTVQYYKQNPKDPPSDYVNFELTTIGTDIT